MQMVSVMFGRSSENLGFLFWQRETTQISENCCHLRGRCEPMRTVGLRVAATQKPSDWNFAHCARCSCELPTAMRTSRCPFMGLLKIPLDTSLQSAIHKWAGSSMPLQRSEEHTSELQSLMRISYAGFGLKKKKNTKNAITTQST